MNTEDVMDGMVGTNENLGDGDIWAWNNSQKMVNVGKMWNIGGKRAVTFQCWL